MDAALKKLIAYSPAGSLDNPESGFRGFHPGTTVLKAGSVMVPGAMPLPCDILFERDVAVTMRDGATIYIDIFRPVDDTEKVPAIINAGTFGKNGPYIDLDKISVWTGAKNRFGIPRAATSGLETWEGTDPAFWVNCGYAVVNVDNRGCGMSEGDAPYFGTQEAEDDYDVIEYLGTRDWCNGKVTMSGNSWLCIVQWYAAAMQPPHLACIAPWEGHTDLYRDEMVDGGIPNYPAVRRPNAYGRNKMEDMILNIRDNPLMNDYWRDKVIALEKIQCPAYIVASYTSMVHCQGTLRAWRTVSSREKWLRIHHTQEWHDLYDPFYTQDLKRFYDHYLKGMNNGWEHTPTCRISVLDPGGEDIVERVENEFPLARQQFRKLYLDADTMTLNFEQGKAETSMRYRGDDGKSIAKFTFPITEETEIVGYMKLRLWVEADGHDDMDLFVKISKVGPDGKYRYHDAIMCDYSGPDSRHRVSLRKLDEEKSLPEIPYYTYDTVEKLRPGEIVPVDIAIWPTGLRFHAGETLEVAICGFEYELCSQPKEGIPMGIDNHGDHIIHTGGKYDSHLLVPFIPLD